MAIQPKQQLYILGASTFLAIFSLVNMFIFSDPGTLGIGGFLVFYSSLFLTVLGLGALIGLSVRRIFFTGLFVTDLAHSFRQAFFLALLAVSLLILQSLGLLYWWVLTPIVLFVCFLEIFLQLEV